MNKDEILLNIIPTSLFLDVCPVSVFFIQVLVECNNKVVIPKNIVNVEINYFKRSSSLHHTALLM